MSTQYINMKNDDVNAGPITFKMYELKILHNMLLESLEEYPDYPMDKIILNKIKDEITKTETQLVVDAIFGKVSNTSITLDEEEENYWDYMEQQYNVQFNDLPF